MTGADGRAERFQIRPLRLLLLRGFQIPRDIQQPRDRVSIASHVERDAGTHSVELGPVPGIEPVDLGDGEQLDRGVGGTGRVVGVRGVNRPPRA